MKHKTLFFSIASIVLLVLTATFIYIVSSPRQFPRGPVLWAEKLSIKPEKYIVVTKPDRYLLEALSNPETDVFVGSWDNTNIDELVETYQTFNVEYNDAYYTVNLGDIDPVYGGFLLILLISWIALGVGFLISHVTARRA